MGFPVHEATGGCASSLVKALSELPTEKGPGIRGPFVIPGHVALCQTELVSSPERTVLITGAGGPAGRSLGRQLAERVAEGLSVRVIGVDLAPLEATGYDQVVGVPPAADLGYGPAMRDVVSAFAPDVIIPTVQDELPQIAVLADVLARAAADARPDHVPARVVTAGATGSAIASDKLLTMWALAAAGVSVPVHAPANAFASAADALTWAGGPVVVKPRVSRGGRGVVLIEDPAGVDWSTFGAAHVVQNFAGGTEYAPQTYRSGDGSVRSYVLEKTVLKEGRVGNAADAIRLPDGSLPEIEQLAIATVEALGLVGPVDMDVRLDDAGRPLVLEVNGRFGALSALAPELLAGVLADHLLPR